MNALHETPPRTSDGVVLLVGVVFCSTSVLFIKSSEMHAAPLAAGRLWLGSLLLGPLFLRDLRRHREVFGRRAFVRSLLPGFLLGLHLLSWNVGARLTSAVNASLVVNMVPLATPLFLWLLARERLNRPEWIGTGLGIAGIILLTGRDYELSPEHSVGDLICFVSMLLFALYLVFARRNRDLPTVFLYVVPLYAMAALTCSVATLFVEAPFDLADPGWELAMVAGLAVFPTVLGHSALNYSMTRFRGQIVPIAMLGQPLSAGVLAFFLLQEIPTPTFYVACLLILCGAALAVAGSPQALPAEPPAPDVRAQSG